MPGTARIAVVCFAETSSVFTLWESLSEAAQAAQEIPMCRQACTGEHAVVFMDGSRIRVLSTSRPSLTDQHTQRRTA